MTILLMTKKATKGRNIFMSALDEYTVWTEREKMGKNAEALEGFYQELIARIQRVDPITLAETAEVQYRGGMAFLVWSFLF